MDPEGEEHHLYDNSRQLAKMGWMDKALGSIGKIAGAVNNPFELGDLG